MIQLQIQSCNKTENQEVLLMKNSTFFGNAGWHWTLRVVALVLAACLMISAVPFSAAAAQVNGATFKAGKVLFREKDFTITAREMTKQKNSGNIELKLTVKNTGKETLRFQDSYGEIEHCSMSLLRSRCILTCWPWQLPDSNGSKSWM